MSSMSENGPLNVYPRYHETYGMGAVVEGLTRVDLEAMIRFLPPTLSSRLLALISVPSGDFESTAITLWPDDIRQLQAGVADFLTRHENPAMAEVSEAQFRVMVALGEIGVINSTGPDSSRPA